MVDMESLRKMKLTDLSPYTFIVSLLSTPSEEKNGELCSTLVFFFPQC